MINPIAEPAARTVLDQSTFSAVSGSTLGTSSTESTLRIESESDEEPPLEDVCVENVPINVWISLIGASAGGRG